MRQTLLALTLLAASAAAQQPANGSAGSTSPSITLSRDEIATLAKAQFAINNAHDSSNAQLAKPANKKFDVQIQLQQKFRDDVAQILHHAGLTDAQYRKHTYMVSLDTASRRVYDSVVVVLTGARLPGVMAGVVKLPVPAGAVGTHLGHVVNGFAEAPALMGLLPAAIAEARIAAGHATLASRQPTNLEYMKTHAGHVIHAIDPTIITMGPGLGMGVKKAANAVITHMGLAKQADAGATPGITVHSTHIEMCANNTIARADQLLELAKKVMSSTTAADASALVNQMMSLADQLIEGADGNSDGRITWEKNEGGLRVADEHAKLMLGVKP
jgi:hypothetical protein